MKIYTSIAVAIICSIIPFVIASNWIQRTCRIILLLIVLDASVTLFLSHRLTTVSVFQGKQKHEIENYTEGEKEALHKGIILNANLTGSMIPFFIIPAIGLFVLSEFKTKKNPNQRVDPTREGAQSVVPEV